MALWEFLLRGVIVAALAYSTCSLLLQGPVAGLIRGPAADVVHGRDGTIERVTRAANELLHGADGTVERVAQAANKLLHGPEGTVERVAQAANQLLHGPEGTVERVAQAANQLLHGPDGTVERVATRAEHVVDHAFDRAEELVNRTIFGWLSPSWFRSLLSPRRVTVVNRAPAAAMEIRVNPPMPCTVCSATTSLTS